MKEDKIEIGESIKDKIVKTYMEYCKNFDSYPQIAILIKPETFLQLRRELMERATAFTSIPYSIQLCGNQTPIVIKNGLPENIEFLIMSKEDYEKWELGEKLTERMENK